VEGQGQPRAFTSERLFRHAGRSWAAMRYSCRTFAAMVLGLSMPTKYCLRIALDEICCSGVAAMPIRRYVSALWGSRGSTRCANLS
jgi:hypothetical protein